MLLSRARAAGKLKAADLVTITAAPGRSPHLPDPIRVAIVDDDEPLRDGLAVIIGTTRGYQSVGRYGSVEDALRGLAAASAHVLLLDITLPGMCGTEGVRVLKERFAGLEVVMLTIYADQDKVFESICNGASGYLLKNTPPARLLEGIRDVLDGGAPISPEIARKVLGVFRESRPVHSDDPLTPQEVRLLGLLADGYSYRSAGDDLGITVNTVRNYVRSIYDKLHVHSKSEAVSKALRSGIIS